MAMPDLGPERITEIHLDWISLVSHAGMHHGRDVAEFFFKKSWRHDANHGHYHGACHQLRVAALERDPRGMVTLDWKLLASYESRSGTGCRKRSQNCKRDANMYAHVF